MYIFVYWVEVKQVDAFTDSAFKGNPAAVCLLEEDRDDHWLQSVAAEFNMPVTCYLTRLLTESESDGSSTPRFRLRWFTPVLEVCPLCHSLNSTGKHFVSWFLLFREILVDDIDFNACYLFLTCDLIRVCVLIPSSLLWLSITVLNSSKINCFFFSYLCLCCGSSQI